VAGSSRTAKEIMICVEIAVFLAEQRLLLWIGGVISIGVKKEVHTEKLK
jgi:hypothetical protein